MELQVKGGIVQYKSPTNHLHGCLHKDYYKPHVLNQTILSLGVLWYDNLSNRYLYSRFDYFFSRQLQVLIIGHVTPGGFERHAGQYWFTAHQDEGDQYDVRYYGIIQKYYDVIAAQLYGHQHTDSFKLFYSTSEWCLLYNFCLDNPVSSFELLASFGFVTSYYVVMNISIALTIENWRLHNKT